MTAWTPPTPAEVYDENRDAIIEGCKRRGAWSVAVDAPASASVGEDGGTPTFLALRTYAYARQTLGSGYAEFDILIGDDRLVLEAWAPRSSPFRL